VKVIDYGLLICVIKIVFTDMSVDDVCVAEKYWLQEKVNPVVV
jgi:hypothetical protein